MYPVVVTTLTPPKGKGGINTTQQVNPRVHAHLLARFHHLQCLVQQDLSGQCVVDDLDHAVGQGKASARGILLHANTTTERELNNDTPAQGVGNILIPERQVTLYDEGATASALESVLSSRGTFHT